jgi:TRAP-type C4-dicarboxylate transport system permease small subunit
MVVVVVEGTIISTHSIENVLDKNLKMFENFCAKALCIFWCGTMVWGGSQKLENSSAPHHEPHTLWPYYIFSNFMENLFGLYFVRCVCMCLLVNECIHSMRAGGCVCVCV